MNRHDSQERLRSALRASADNSPQDTVRAVSAAVLAVMADLTAESAKLMSSLATRIEHREHDQPAHDQPTQDQPGQDNPHLP